ncbi:HAMP domain-containing sensor histidine kinase [Clostridium sp. C8-1-8]|uniref:PAS domain-containing sensor histidine kinase n=1 Tax=Clostridium sp. C8-1-8 TaxID=2698831 RepID=UPI0013698367|nr:HAMP domain-containing sensor histidine kinase [Clostridium sp. C8-1-8]
MLSEQLSHRIEYGAYFTTINSIVVKASNEFFYLSGYSVDETIGKNVSELYEMIRLNIDSLSLNENRSYYIFDSKLNSIEVDILIESNNYSNEITYFLIRKEAQSLGEKLPIFERLYLDNRSGVAVFAMPDRILLKANQTYLDFFDKPFNSRETTYGRKVDEFVTGWDLSPFKGFWDQVIKTKQSLYIDEYSFPHFEKGITYWDGSLIPIVYNEQLKYVVEITNDITDKVTYRNLIEQQSQIIKEEKQKAERALKMQEEFFSFISHEFKTPLTVAMSATQFLELTCKDTLSDMGKKYLRKIHQSSLQQLRLVNNLLDITRADTGYLKFHNRNVDIVTVTKAIVDSIALLAKEKKIDVKFSSTISELIMAIDDEKYERIILNLLSNAIKFTDVKGNIYVKLSKKKGEFCIRVIDEGVGIPKDKQNIIFERFGQVNNSLTRASEGTGIGLCLVKLLVNSLGGTIELDSEVGKGSVFTILLPITIADDFEESNNDLMNDRLARAVNIEFSNVYLNYQ